MALNRETSGLLIDVLVVYVLSLSPYSTKKRVCVGCPTQMKSTQKNEMYMPNTKTQRQGPNATYIPLAGVGVLRRDKRNFSVSRRVKTRITCVT